MLRGKAPRHPPASSAAANHSGEEGVGLASAEGAQIQRQQGGGCDDPVSRDLPRSAPCQVEPPADLDGGGERHDSAVGTSSTSTSVLVVMPTSSDSSASSNRDAPLLCLASATSDAKAADDDEEAGSLAVARAGETSPADRSAVSCTTMILVEADAPSPSPPSPLISIVVPATPPPLVPVAAATRRDAAAVTPPPGATGSGSSSGGNSIRPSPRPATLAPLRSETGARGVAPSLPALASLDATARWVSTGGVDELPPHEPPVENPLSLAYCVINETTGSFRNGGPPLPSEMMSPRIDLRSAGSSPSSSRRRSTVVSFVDDNSRESRTSSIDPHSGRTPSQFQQGGGKAAAVVGRGVFTPPAEGSGGPPRRASEATSSSHPDTSCAWPDAMHELAMIEPATGRIRPALRRASLVPYKRPDEPNFFLDSGFQVPRPPPPPRGSTCSSSSVASDPIVAPNGSPFSPALHPHTGAGDSDVLAVCGGCDWMQVLDLYIVVHRIQGTIVSSEGQAPPPRWMARPPPERQPGRPFHWQVPAAGRATVLTSLRELERTHALVSPSFQGMWGGTQHLSVAALGDATDRRASPPPSSDVSRTHSLMSNDSSCVSWRSRAAESTATRRDSDDGSSSSKGQKLDACTRVLCNLGSIPLPGDQHDASTVLRSLLSAPSAAIVATNRRLPTGVDLGVSVATELSRLYAQRKNRAALSLFAGQTVQGVDEVLPGLYLGSYHVFVSREDMAAYGITHVVTCVNMTPFADDSDRCDRFDDDDEDGEQGVADGGRLRRDQPCGASAPLSPRRAGDPEPGGRPTDRSWRLKYGPVTYLNLDLRDDTSEDVEAKGAIEQSVAFLQEHWYVGGRTVGVHCGAGVSRATTVMGLALKRLLGLGFRQVMELMVRARPGVRPNPRFLELLKRGG